jgi:hypothetical protein
MIITAALLCDAANVREGLVNVLSAGITNIKRVSYPGPLGVTLFCMVEIPADEVGRSGKVSVEVRMTDQPDREAVASIAGSWETARGSSEPDEKVPGNFPVVVNLSQVMIPEPGYYYVKFELDDGEARVLSFRANLQL